ncbi:S8 family serine peptidase [Paenibacillus sp. FSL R5-0527]|uniref:S8 family serine peptidase n=1 Tax=Paenibacillus TaxID=44249 RepID=UPI00097B5A9F|nr:S8 family serine peptidase [Paenibacillus macerans]MED4955055.1 S8 family serine peptidase [Paenibacillus macerans]OMG50604.1 hypothetical protein BK140_04365 [Paenibacillus macerans]
MNKVRVAIIDSGISKKSECIENVSESYMLNKSDEIYSIIKCEPIDYIGHGTAVAHIIYKTNINVELVCIRICDYTMEVDEEGLIFVLEYIYKNVDIDIINISAGITYLSNYKGMNKVCNNLYKKGVVIVSAFDNDGAISYPAALNAVIGVDTKDEYGDRKDIYYVENSIIDILVPNKFYRTIWNDRKTILKGSSFATACITGMLSQIIKNFMLPYKKNDLLKAISNTQINVKQSSDVESPSFQIKKAILFPLNKESQVLLRFKKMLKFEIAGVYDEKTSGNVGRTLFGEYIESFDSINWSDDFDTIILSCTSELSTITKRNYSEEILNMAEKQKKNIYTFEKIISDYKEIFYPSITSNIVPYGNYFKLHKATIPIVGVFGTSSKQGKFTLQLNIIRRLSELGYSVGHISTEPSGYLFDADYVFHFGYRANLKIQPWECISILNKMVWNTQLKEKDILITGCQSGTLHYNNSEINNFTIYQYAFTLGVMPDFCILCINPHDDIEYISRTISFINSIDEGKVRAIAIFPIQAIETVTGIKYKTRELFGENLQVFKEKIYESFKIPVYSVFDDLDLDNLCDLIISYFGE